MQGFCRLSRRWHQQFCHSPSFGPHQRCLQSFVPVREYRQITRGNRKARREIPSPQPQPLPRFDPFPDIENTNPFSPSQLLSRDNDDLVVREFEQHGADKSSRREIEPAKELRDEAEQLWAEIEDVDRQLEIAKQGPFGPQSKFMQQFREEKRREILETLAKEGVLPEDEEDALDLAEIDRMMEEEDDTHDDNDRGMAVTLHIPKAHQALVGHFNKSLEQAQSNPEDTLKALNLWKWYLRCQQKIPGFSQIVSERVWRLLWLSQSQLGARTNHLVILGKDMIDAGEVMTDEEHLQYVQALNTSGDVTAALSTWEGMQGDLKSTASSDFLSSFFAIGVQLYTAVGRPQKAQSIAFGAIDRGANPNILIHVITGWAASKTASSSAKAWAIYLRMRSILGEDMSPETYEAVSDSLLENRQNHMALAVFKDMISRVNGSGTNTLEAYRHALGSIDIEADPEDTEKAINHVSLTMLLTLPRQYQNKFFFASWIKKLLGQQRVESASRVVDLMYERGIRPDAIHLNGIIGAWLRDQSPRARERAEKLALEMIQARINQVSHLSQNLSLREFGNVFRKVMAIDESRNVWQQPLHLERPVAAANLETFSLLFDYNEQRHKWHEFSRLTEIMIGPAQIKPNCFIMNKWLAVELRARSFSRFWALFNVLKHDIVPDVETYGLAWQVVAAQQASASGRVTLSHRQLFADMIQWTQRLNARQLRTAKEDFEAGFYSQIVRSFSYQLDLPGTLCALQGIHDAFGATPDDVSVRLITGQVARILPRLDPTKSPVGGRRRASAKLSSDQTSLKSIADIISTLETKRKIELVESEQASAEEVEDSTSAASRKIRLDVMIEFLLIVMQKTKKSTENPAKTLRDVAKVMHVDVDHISVDLFSS